MNALVLLFVLWFLASLTLCMALMLLAIFYAFIENDLYLDNLGKEGLTAIVASFVEAVGLWLVIVYVPTAVRAMVVPTIVVALIYKITHLDDWNRYDILLLLIFQVVIVCLGASLFLGKLEAAVVTFVVFTLVLALIYAFAKGI